MAGAFTLWESAATGSDWESNDLLPGDKICMIEKQLGVVNAIMSCHLVRSVKKVLQLSQTVDKDSLDLHIFLPK